MSTTEETKSTDIVADKENQVVNETTETEKPSKVSQIEGDEAKEKFIADKMNKIWEEYFLSPFQKFAVQKFIRDNVGNRENHKVDRVREWFMARLNGSRCTPQGKMQLGCPEIIPQLRAQPFWDTSAFEWVKTLEDNMDVIKEELLTLKDKSGFRPYRGPSWASNIQANDKVGSVSHDSGSWNVFYLFLHEIKFEENCAKCPKTVELIERVIPRHYHHAFFSCTNPDTHIMKHHGPTNKKLRIHIPLTGTEGSRLRAAEEMTNFEEGKVVIFDDSFEHEAWHDGPVTRINLIIDIWHPDLSDEEVKFLRLLNNSKLKAEKAISEKDESGDNFFAIIEKSQHLIKDNSWWITNQQENEEPETKESD